MRFKHALACARPADSRPRCNRAPDAGTRKPAERAFDAGLRHRARTSGAVRRSGEEGPRRARGRADRSAGALAGARGARVPRGRRYGVPGAAAGEPGKKPSSRLLVLGDPAGVANGAADASGRARRDRPHGRRGALSGRQHGRARTRGTLAEYFIARCKGAGTFKRGGSMATNSTGTGLSPRRGTRHPQDHIVPLGAVTVTPSAPSWLVWEKAKTELDGSESGNRR